MHVGYSTIPWVMCVVLHFKMVTWCAWPGMSFPPSQEPHSGELLKFQSALLHSKKQRCAHCGEPGASIGCNVHRCKHSFHFGCLEPAGAVLFDDRRAP